MIKTARRPRTKIPKCCACGAYATIAPLEWHLAVDLFSRLMRRPAAWALYCADTYACVRRSTMRM